MNLKLKSLIAAAVWVEQAYNSRTSDEELSEAFKALKSAIKHAEG